MLAVLLVFYAICIFIVEGYIFFYFNVNLFRNNFAKLILFQILYRQYNFIDNSKVKHIDFAACVKIIV